MPQEVVRDAVVKAAVGLHARPASRLAQAAADSAHKVRISKGGGDPVNAASILSIIALGAKCGESVSVFVEGDDAEAVADRLVALIESEEE